MKPYYEEAGITIYHGDCREIMWQMPPVNHVITDPPYEKEAHDPGRRLNGRTAELEVSTTREIDPAPLSFEPMTPELRRFVSHEFSRLCSGWVLTFCQVEAVSLWKDELEHGGSRYRRAMAWVKPDSSPQLSGDRPAQGFESIVAAWAGKGKSVWNGGGKRGVFTHCKHDPGHGHGGTVNEHQTRKPMSLMKQLINLFTDPDQTILDAFMGSGTTLVAAKELHRKAIGIELDERYCEIAANRLRQSVFNFEVA